MIYEEGIGKTWETTGVVGAVAAVVGVVFMVVGPPSDSGGIAALGLLLVMFGVLAAIAAFGMRRYSLIELDSATLRVGRHHVAVSDLVSVLNEDQLPEDVLARARNPMPSKGPGGRLFGGGYGLNHNGIKAVGFTTRSNPELQVFGTKNPAALTEALRVLLGS